jgi:hypothetical protein
MGDGVRTLPGATLSPYLARVKSGSLVGYNPPAIRLPDATDASAADPV